MALNGIVDEKYLVCEERVTLRVWDELPAFYSNFHTTFWSDRYVSTQIQLNEQHWDLTIRDLLVNESRQVRFRKSVNQVGSIEIFLLDNKYGFAVEYFSGTRYVNFVKTDWSAGEFHLVDQFVRECWKFDILMDSLKPTKFILKTRNERDSPWLYQMCKVVGSNFQFSETYESDIHFHQYANDKLIGFKRREEKFLIESYNWVTKQERIFEIDVVPERFDFIHYDASRLFQNTINSFFYFESGRQEYRDRNLDVMLKFSNGNFIVYASDRNDRDDGMIDFTVKVFSIPIQRPNLLRNSAWLLVVKMMKQKGEVDPYAAAKKYLPLNTDLRSAWFEDEENDAESSQVDGILSKLKNWAMNVFQTIKLMSLR